jgi:NADPH-dependent ferric siderophore reductase
VIICRFNDIPRCRQLHWRRLTNQHTQVAPAPVEDRVPPKEEIADAVYRLKNNKAMGPSGMKAEHFKDWYKAVFPEPQTDNPNAPTPKPEQWNRFVEMVQNMFAPARFPLNVLGPSWL